MRVHVSVRTCDIGGRCAFPDGAGSAASRRSQSGDHIQHITSANDVLGTLEKIEEHLPQVIGDPAKLTQILVNLLTNAIKFTQPGGRVQLKVERHAHRGMTFRVEDTGIGMSVAQIPIALEPFGQIDTGLARNHSGVGLGLPLTKRLVELHDGTIEIESEPGKGTVVTVSLPEERLRES
jgi:signal transduction histidine kinase